MRRAVLVLLVSCAPSVDGPREDQRARDAGEAARIEAQLVALPGVERAKVSLDRPMADPLSLAPAGPPSASAVIVVESEADRVRIDRDARALVPVAGATIVIEIGKPKPVRSSAVLRIGFALALVAIAVLAAAVARLARRRA